MSRPPSRGGTTTSDVVKSNATFLEDIYRGECVDDAIEFIWSSFSTEVTSRWLSTIDKPIAVEIAMLKMNKIVAWAVVEHDGDVGTEKPLEQLNPDSEPVPVAIDTWARGTVPIRKAPVETFSFGGSDSRLATPSVGSFRSSAKPRSPGHNTKGRRGSNTSGISAATGGGRRSANGGTLFEDDTGKIIDMADGDDFDDMNVTGSMFDMLQKTKRLKNKDVSADEEAKDEFALLEEEIKKVKEESKGKKVIVDKDGKVVTVRNINPEALPPFAMPLQLSIYERPDVSDEKSDKKKKKRGVRVAGSRRVDDLYFKASDNLSTTLSAEPEKMPIQAGVSLKVGDAFKEGPPAPSDPKRLSRKQYFSATGSSSVYGGGSSYEQSRTTGLADQSVTDTLAEEHASSYISGLESPDSLASGSYRGNNRMADIDVLEGGRRIKPSSPKLEEEVVHANYPSQHVKFANDDGDDDNGKSRRPLKPSLKQKAEALSTVGPPTVKWGPRDRNIPLSMVPVAERRRLPAPSLGQSTGHGLAVPGTISSPDTAASASASGSKAPPHRIGVSSKSTVSFQSQDSWATSKGGGGGGGGSIKAERADLVRQLLK